MNLEELETGLKRFLPPNCEKEIADLIRQHKVQFKVVSKRSSKLGDYYYVSPDYQRITVNNHLNPYQFLFVSLHEFAHLHVNLQQGKKKVKPHGEEWKKAFRKLVNPFLQRSVFPVDLHVELERHMLNPSASSSADPVLYACFKKYDVYSENGPHTLRVEQIPLDGYFLLKKMVFQKTGKRRTRYTCRLIPTQRIYWVHGLAEVIPLSEEDMQKINPSLP